MAAFNTTLVAQYHNPRDRYIRLASSAEIAINNSDSNNTFAITFPTDLFSTAMILSVGLDTNDIATFQGLGSKEDIGTSFSIARKSDFIWHSHHGPDTRLRSSLAGASTEVMYSLYIPNPYPFPIYPTDTLHLATNLSLDTDATPTVDGFIRVQLRVIEY